MRKVGCVAFRRVVAALLALTALAACSETSPAPGGASAGGAGGASVGAAGATTSGNGGTSSGTSGTTTEGGMTGGEGNTSGASGSGGGGNTSGSGASGGEGNANGGSGGSGTAGGSSGAGVDVFGVEQLYPSAARATEWSSEHWQGDAYEISERIDERDPLGLSGMRGTGTLLVDGEGELVMSGSQPRIYVYPSDDGPWKNLEITAYYQRVSDAGTAYAGLVIGARSGPDGHTDATSCDAHTYYARIRNDGAFDFEKELKHPASSVRASVAPATAWPPTGQVPLSTWIGFKLVIYNLSTPGAVKLEAYRDVTNGVGGGDWQKVIETVDDGGWFVASDCSEHDPNDDGESDLVVTDGGTVFIRNTDVTEARYRWVTVREIVAP